MDPSPPSNKRMKIFGAVLAAVLLVVVGVVSLNSKTNVQIVSLERAQAIARTKDASTALTNLPDESSLETPQGWVIESDEPVEDSSDVKEGMVEELGGLEQEAAEEDDDIDSPLLVEEDKQGEKFVAELGAGVIVEEDKTTNGLVAADSRCYRNLKACGAKKACYRKCNKKCRPYALRQCVPRKFCRCFCKHYGKGKKARKCVIYRRKVCIKGKQYLCKRRCNKFCKKVPRCFCCPKTHIRRKCRKNCRRFLYRSKCASCTCYKVKCYRACRFLCLKKY